MSKADLPSDWYRDLVNSSLPSLINRSRKTGGEEEICFILKLESNYTTCRRDVRRFVQRHPQKLGGGEGEAEAL